MQQCHQLFPFHRECVVCLFAQPGDNNKAARQAAHSPCGAKVVYREAAALTASLPSPVTPLHTQHLLAALAKQKHQLLAQCPYMRLQHAAHRLSQQLHSSKWRMTWMYRYAKSSAPVWNTISAVCVVCADNSQLVAQSCATLCPVGGMMQGS